MSLTKQVTGAALLLLLCSTMAYAIQSDKLIRFFSGRSVVSDECGDLYYGADQVLYGADAVSYGVCE